MVVAGTFSFDFFCDRRSPESIAACYALLSRGSCDAALSGLYAGVECTKNGECMGLCFELLLVKATVELLLKGTPLK